MGRRCPGLTPGLHLGQAEASAAWRRGGRWWYRPVLGRPGRARAAWYCCWRARIRAAAGSLVAEELGGLVARGWRTCSAAATLEVLGRGGNVYLTYIRRMFVAVQAAGLIARAGGWRGRPRVCWLTGAGAGAGGANEPGANPRTAFGVMAG